MGTFNTGCCLFVCNIFGIVDNALFQQIIPGIPHKSLDGVIKSKNFISTTKKLPLCQFSTSPANSVPRILLFGLNRPSINRIINGFALRLAQSVRFTEAARTFTRISFFLVQVFQHLELVKHPGIHIECKQWLSFNKLF